MDEDVLSAIGRLNKSKALLAVKPLNGSLVHSDFLSLTSLHTGPNARSFFGAIVPVGRFWRSV
jgi:hypothetical protein